MSSSKTDDSFKQNFVFWKVFGIWPGRRPSIYYKYYSFVYLFITLFAYNILLTLNLIYTPLKIELLLREVIFYFTEIAVTAKVFMVLFKRDEIFAALDLFECEGFDSGDTICEHIIEKSNAYYKFYYKIYAIVSNIAYSSQVFLSIFVYMIWNTELNLPICKYYFLSNYQRDTYFVYWYIYQSIGMYGHMMYNVNIDSFIAGVILKAVTQLRVLNTKLVNLKLEPIDRKKSIQEQDKIQLLKLNSALKRYDLFLKYCSIIQSLLSITMFVQFAMATAIICVVLCGLLMPSTVETMVFMIIYLIAMTSQIFVPGFLGTQLHYESQQLVSAAYSSEWIPRSQEFKSNLRIFTIRANTPIQIVGMKMFPLSLGTFTSIMKTSYSFFALIKNVNDRQN